MRRLSKNKKQIGKLSNKKIQSMLSSSSFKQDKNVSAALPFLNRIDPLKIKPHKNHIHKSRVVQKIQVSRSLLLDDGREDPLPQINICFGQPLQLKKKGLKNPQQQQYFVDPHKPKISKYTSTPKNQNQINLIGKLYSPLYSPRSSSLKIDINKLQQARVQSQKREINAQKQQNIQKDSKNKKSVHFKNFLNHEYVKQLKLKQKGHIQMEDYNFKFNQSTNSNAFKEQSKNNQKRYNSFIRQEKTIQKYEQKPVYIASVRSQTHFQVLLKDQGNAYVQKKQTSFNDIEQKQQQLINNYKGRATIGTIITLEHPLDIIGRHREQEEDVISIDYLTGISRIKQILIQHDSVAKINFKISSLLFKPLFQNVTQPEIHLFSQIIFKELIGVKPQLISIKRFINCILITTKNILSRVSNEKIGILRYFNGKFYIGGWRVNSQNEGCKQGYGYQYVPKFLYFGQYKDNIRRGYGVQKKINGDVYIGEWCQGKREGWGKTFINDSLSQDGDYEQNNFKSSRLLQKVS